MALKSKSLFVYGLSVTLYNRSLDFRIVGAGTILQATLNLGFYSLTSLCAEIARAMQAADPAHIYSASVDRTVNGGLENRITIATNGGYLELDFSSGPRVATSCAALIGFLSADRTGATSYTGATSAGIPVLSSFFGFSYIPPALLQKNYGAVNITASGDKESITFATQQFSSVNFSYEPLDYVVGTWSPLMQWMMQQKPFEFTPEISDPTTVYPCTLESTATDSSGLAFQFTEMLPSFPGFYTTGVLKFRVSNVVQPYIF